MERVRHAKVVAMLAFDRKIYGQENHIKSWQANSSFTFTGDAFMWPYSWE